MAKMAMPLQTETPPDFAVAKWAKWVALEKEPRVSAQLIDELQELAELSVIPRQHTLDVILAGEVALKCAMNLIECLIVVGDVG